jgi:hypothetical protein
VVQQPATATVAQRKKGRFMSKSTMSALQAELEESSHSEWNAPVDEIETLTEDWLLLVEVAVSRSEFCGMGGVL